MYYSDSVRHLLLTPITKYKFTVQGSFWQVSHEITLIHVLWRFCETLVTNTYY